MSRATELAREHTDSAIQVVTEIMNDPFAENKDRLKAAQEILDRGHGKPTQAVIAVPPSKKLAQQLAALTNDELLAIVKGTPLPRLSAPIKEAAIDAHFEEVDPVYPPGEDPIES